MTNNQPDDARDDDEGCDDDGGDGEGGDDDGDDSEGGDDDGDDGEQQGGEKEEQLGVEATTCLMGTSPASILLAIFPSRQVHPPRNFLTLCFNQLSTFLIIGILCFLMKNFTLRY